MGGSGTCKKRQQTIVSNRAPGQGLWPTLVAWAPQDEHAKRMMRDIAASYEGAMWIDDLVKRARERLLGTA